MNRIITFLLMYIQLQQRIIVYLIGSLTGKYIARNIYDEPLNKPYRKLQIDKLPMIEKPEK